MGAFVKIDKKYNAVDAAALITTGIGGFRMSKLKATGAMISVATFVLAAPFTTASATNFDQSSTNDYWVVNTSSDFVDPTIGYCSDSCNSIFIGTGASISISASGAVASISASSINADIPAFYNGLNQISQNANNQGVVSNLYIFDGYNASNVLDTGGTLPVGSGISFGNLSIELGDGSVGVGGSASISASGAVASLSFANINITGTSDIAMQGFNELNQAGGLWLGYDTTNITYTDLNGDSFQRFTAAGSHFGWAKIADGDDGPAPGAYNLGTVQNSGVINHVGFIDVGASVSTSASGSVTSLSYSIANNNQDSPFISAHIDNVGPIAQSTMNEGWVYNNSGIYLSSDQEAIGTGSSISISATGSVAAVSQTAINANTYNSNVLFYEYGTIQQASSNYGSVTNYNGEIGNVSRDVGLGASLSVSASGAVSSIAFSSISDSGTVDFALPDINSSNLLTTFDNGTQSAFGVAQFAYNNGNIDNAGGDISNNTGNPIGDLYKGAQVSVSASGAVASFSVNGIYSNISGASQVANSNTTHINSIGQFAKNSGAINNGNEGSALIKQDGILFTGASISISASGAVSSFSVTANNSDLAPIEVYNSYASYGSDTPLWTSWTDWTDPSTTETYDTANYIGWNPLNDQYTGIVALLQTSYNFGTIYNEGYVSSDGTQNLNRGASVSISASGAVASFSATGISDSSNEFNIPNLFVDNYYANYIAEQTGAFFEDSYGLLQAAANYANVTNTGNFSVNSVGTGASASVSASGAVASYSVTGNNVSVYQSNDRADSLTTSGITETYFQSAQNTANITNSTGIGDAYFGELGTGASVSVSASGAVASVSLTFVESSFNGASYSGFTQAAYNTGNVTNSGNLNGSNGPGTIGRGASVSVSATGAVSSVAISALNNTLMSEIYISSVDQGSDSWLEGWAVYNSGTIQNSGTISNASNLSEGSSVSVSATGAVASFSITANHSDISSANTLDNGGVRQFAKNDGVVRNYWDGSPNDPNTIEVGALGTAASVSVSASGAVVSTSFTAINSETDIRLEYHSGIHQGAENSTSVTNVGTISSFSNLGLGASASVSASGAVSSIAFNFVNDGVTQITASVPNVDHANQAELGTTRCASNCVYNSGDIYNDGEITLGDSIGNGASVSVSASGAVSSVSITGNQVALGGTNFGWLNQNSKNDAADITNYGSIYSSSLTVGASASISATGAVSSLGVTALNSTLGGEGFTAGVLQNATTTDTTSTIMNTGDIRMTGGSTLGSGASVSISASGAVAAVSITGVNSGFQNDILSVPGFNYITQTALNDAEIKNYGVIGGQNSFGSNGGVDFAGSGASISISASGAVSSVAFSGNGVSMSGGTIGALTQTSNNYGEISNYGGGSVNGQWNLWSAPGILGGDLSTAASMSISATGAVSSVSISAINSIFDGAVDVSNLRFNGGISQTAYNEGQIQNYGFVSTRRGSSDTNPEALYPGPILGMSASISISATGAVSSFSFSAVSDGDRNDVYLPAVTNTQIIQSATNSASNFENNPDSGKVDNYSSFETTVRTLENGTLASTTLREGASISSSATGAVSAVSFSANNENLWSNEVYSVSQTSINEGAITNHETSIAVWSMSDGASVSISAAGAVSSVSYNFINSTWADEIPPNQIDFGVSQTATNTNYVSNGGTGSGIEVIKMPGVGASVSISASGAVASLSYSSLGATGDNLNPGLSTENITQTATNGGNDSFADVSNIGLIRVQQEANIGVGSSLSISASGATASFSVASILDNAPIAMISNTGITQTATNHSAVTNTGTIVFNNGASLTNASTLGTGASASISASGAVAAVSLRTIQ